MNTKLCVRCNLEKPVSDFHQNFRNKDGFHSYCKKCNKEKAAAHLKTDKGKAALSKAIGKAQDRGYYRFGKGAIPILRQGAQKRGISFDLTAESLEIWWHSQLDACFYCGSSLNEYLAIRDFLLSYEGNNFEISKFKRFFRSPKHQVIRWMTIDRKQNDQGYELKNIVKSCWICNSLKNDFFEGDQMKLISPQLISKLKHEIDKEKV
ncbi:MAG: hypothetical protein A2Z47_12695 [Thermodesulfovibrio sp. RBG_19FT_COMBO_42_12]|nr:MAG: hypothetical protein A2Z47_12695 [Thermodesulfovibrio sp. RBG_19FT_COMBO_42_12]